MDEAIEQLRHLLKEAKTRLLCAENVIKVSALTCPMAKNYVEKHLRDMDALRNEFTKAEILHSATNESSNGSAHDAV